MALPRAFIEPVEFLPSLCTLIYWYYYYYVYYHYNFRLPVKSRNPYVKEMFVYDVCAMDEVKRVVRNSTKALQSTGRIFVLLFFLFVSTISLRESLGGFNFIFAAVSVFQRSSGNYENGFSRSSGSSSKPKVHAKQQYNSKRG